jgi:dienelactone hydrolase
VLTFTYVDESRTTAAYADVAEAPQRTIETTVYLPGTTDPAPLVIFAHGAAGLPERFSELALEWAEAGFVVALPKFPLSNADDMRRTVDDPIVQAGDLKFVTDQLIESEATPGSLNGRINFDHIGVGGLSLGSVTTYVHAFAECCADSRLDAVMGLAGLFAVGEGAQQLDLPLFVAHGDNDVVLGYEGGRAAYDSAGGERWMFTAFGGTHAAPFQNDDTVYDDSFRAASTAFWELTLKGDDTARARILAAAEADITRIEERTG